MKITVPTTNANLRDLLTDAQFSVAHAAVAEQDGYFRVAVQNLSLQDIYVETGFPSSVSTGTKIPANGGQFIASTDAMEKLNFVAANSAATDVRIMVG